MESQDKPMDKMTVKELREIAKEIPGIIGVHSMKKDELLAAIADSEGTTAKTVPAEKIEAAAPKAKTKAKAKKTAGASVKTLSSKEIKDKINQLRDTKASSLEDKDKKTASIMRRKINRLKKQSRKKAAAA